MKLYEIIWKDQFVEKLETKHGVFIEEVEEVLFGKPHIRRAQRGRVKGEDYIRRLRTNRRRQIFNSFFHSQRIRRRASDFGA